MAQAGDEVVQVGPDQRQRHQLREHAQRAVLGVHEQAGLTDDALQQALERQVRRQRDDGSMAATPAATPASGNPFFSFAVAWLLESFSCKKIEAVFYFWL